MAKPAEVSYNAPIYLQLREVVRSKIEDGEYAPGTAIPSENLLASTYSINRLTVRSAIDALVNEGLLKRVQGKGVYVVAQIERDLEVWMFPAAGAAKIVVIILMTWLIALGDTTHIVVGSVEILYLVFNGSLHWSDFIWPFALPTLAGNICGGTFIFALMSHAQIRNDMSNARKEKQRLQAHDKTKKD